MSGDAFGRHDFAALAEVEERSFWFRSRNHLIAWAVRRYFPAARDLLEIGCGTGFVLAGLRAACPWLALSGAELGEAGLDIARARLPGVPFHVLDARRLPFEETFDIVGAFDLLEHVEDDAQVLREMRRAARPGGGVVIAVPQHPRLWSAADDYAHHRRRYTRAELVRKLTAAGLDIVRVTSFVSLLLPAMALSRLRDRGASHRYDPRAELRVGGVAGALCAATLSLERALIQRGVSFPAGGSLLAVARVP